MSTDRVRPSKLAADLERAYKAYYDEKKALLSRRKKDLQALKAKTGNKTSSEPPLSINTLSVLLEQLQ